jgi:hypothetical protein
MYMPTAAALEALLVSSAMCADASNPVMVYCAIRSPVANTYQNTAFPKLIPAAPKPVALTVSPKT